MKLSEPDSPQKGTILSSSSFIDDESNNESKKLALITETDSCDNDLRLEESFTSIEKAVSTGGVDLISIRVTSDNNDNIIKLAKKCMSLKTTHPNLKVVINDNIEAAYKANVDGIHVKEKDVSKIPEIRQLFNDRNTLIGTSAHSINSALSTWRLYHPDYFFVGTCYLTQSHPEKTDVDQLEGPQLPGLIRKAIHEEFRTGQSKENSHAPPIVFAIGGINQHNCWEPVSKFGADGVATIRAVLQASDPANVTMIMKKNMV